MLKEIHNHYRKKASNIIADKIKHNIFLSNRQLINFPKSGTEEQTLKRLNQNHRYLVNRNYKIIYKPVKEGILITDVFDTRQNPIKLNNPKR